MRRRYEIPSDRNGGLMTFLDIWAVISQRPPSSTAISSRGGQIQGLQMSKYALLMMLRDGACRRLVVACILESDWIGEGNPEFPAHVRFWLTAYRKHRSGALFKGFSTPSSVDGLYSTTLHLEIPCHRGHIAYPRTFL